VELTTVTDREATIHDGRSVLRLTGLEPGSVHEVHGLGFRTLPTPGGRLLCRVATVNDVHFGEVEAGRIDDLADGPIQRAEPGEPPYPETMNEGAVAEMVAGGVDAVVVKGDLTNAGGDDEFEAFERCYRSAFGPRLFAVRGNHDAYLGQERYAGDQRLEFPGLIVALLDTVIPGQASGRITGAQIEWLDTVAAEADRPLLVMGHHPQWIEGNRSPDYFGINPDDSEALSAVIGRRASIIAYSAGHTHRHRVRRLACGVPSIEVGCVKDFPGTWAEHRVYDGGVMHVVHRISTHAALSWSERCRHLYRDFGVDYPTYALGSLEDRCFVIPNRS
jgi:3',5'-cyclic-AMP phosphodiesterase